MKLDLPLVFGLGHPAAVSLALLIVSVESDDGMSLIATVFLSDLLTLLGWSTRWELRVSLIHIRRAKLPPGGVVIAVPNKSFLVVFCEKEAARVLFWAVEGIRYQVESANGHRLLFLRGTVMLMLGVVVLASSKLPLKFCWTDAYLLLSAAHLIPVALTQQLHCVTSMDSLGKAIVVTKGSMG